MICREVLSIRIYGVGENGGSRQTAQIRWNRHFSYPALYQTPSPATLLVCNGLKSLVSVAKSRYSPERFSGQKLKVFFPLKKAATNRRGPDENPGRVLLWGPENAMLFFYQLKRGALFCQSKTLSLLSFRKRAAQRNLLTFNSSALVRAAMPPIPCFIEDQDRSDSAQSAANSALTRADELNVSSFLCAARF